MTDKEIENERKQIALFKAIRNELGEIILRYSKSRLHPEMLMAAIFTAYLKVHSSYATATIETARKSAGIEKLFEEEFGKGKEGQ